MEKFKRGDVIFLTEDNAKVYVIRKQEEIEEERVKDINCGHWHDDAGESILYSPYSGYPDNTSVMTVKVTSMRSNWSAWWCRPKNLRTGWWVEGQREILFKVL